MGVTSIFIPLHCMTNLWCNRPCASDEELQLSTGRASFMGDNGQSLHFEGFGGCRAQDLVQDLVQLPRVF